MGNDESKGRDAPSILDDYFVKRKVADPRFGFATLMEHKLTKELVVLKEINSNLENDFKTSLLKWEYKLKLQHPNIIQVLGVTHRSDNTFCSTFFKIYILLEMIVKNLEEEIEEKSQKDDPYTETELWFLLDSILNGLYYLQLSGTCHGALRPSSVYLGYNGFYKIAEHTLFNEPPTYTMVQCSPNTKHKGVYLSPNMMAVLRERGDKGGCAGGKLIKRLIYLKAFFLSATQSIFNRELHPIHDPYKSDIFSAGVIMIHAALLKPCDDLYNFDSMEIDENSLSARLKIIKDKYSASLSGIIEKMLEFDEDKRFNYEQLLKTINESEVRNGQKFKEMENSAISTFFFTKQAEAPVEGTSSKLKRSAYYYDTRRKRVNVQQSGNPNPPIIVLSPSQFLDDNRIKFVSTEKASRKYKSPGRSPPEFEPVPVNNNSSVSSFISSSNKELSDLFTPKPISNSNERGAKDWKSSVSSRGVLDNNIDNIISKYAGEGVPRKSRRYSKAMQAGSKQRGMGVTQSRAGERGVSESKLVVPTGMLPRSSKASEAINRDFSPMDKGVKNVVEFYENGARYEGEKFNNKRNGKGKFYYADGGYYEGLFKDNKMEGEGVLYYSSGKLAYKGRFKNDEFDGFGTLINDMPVSSIAPLEYKKLDSIGDLWVSYEGEFSKGEKNGFGVLVFSTGEKYSGQFVDDMPNGKGSFYLRNGQVVSGFWQGGKMK